MKSKGNVDGQYETEEEHDLRVWQLRRMEPVSYILWSTIGLCTYGLHSLLPVCVPSTFSSQG